MGADIKCEKCPECGDLMEYDEYAYEKAKRYGFVCDTCRREEMERQMEH